MLIDYKILSDSTDFYEKQGFKRIEAPWTVTQAISQITKPDFKAEAFTLDKKKKVLVASGEQSFLYLNLKGFLPNGKYQTITPCFREEVFDFTHTKYFMKNELIITDNSMSVKALTLEAFSFYSRYFDPEALEIIETEEGYDINYKEYELGSYGKRKCEFLEWIYGTGVAEPRFSNVLKLYNGNR